MTKIYLALVLMFFGDSFSAPRTVYLDMNAPSQNELIFMKRYGYLEIPEDQGEHDYAYTAHSISEAVMKMQSFAGLSQTGTLDSDTRKLFAKRRCGVKDIGVGVRRRRYVVSQGWNKKDITYRILNGSSTLPKSQIEILMGSALSVWAPHGGLRFMSTDDELADIQVSFATGEHGDGFPFDGPGRVVAHAFPPPHGAMHFDDDEIWADNPDEDSEEVTDFFAVVVHEIGHALGLSHSNVKQSVMYPYYQVPVEKLHPDDIMGIQKLYFNQEHPEDQSLITTENPIQSHTSSAPRFTKADYDDDDDPIPDLCYTNYDTIQVIQGKIYVFEEEWVWVLSDMHQIDPGYPKLFHQVFKGLPEHITAVKVIYEKTNGNIVIFSGD